MHKTNHHRATAFTLLLSLHKYDQWVSSLRSARPGSASVAGKELQRMAALKSEIPGLSRKVNTVLDLHLELIGQLGSAKQGPLHSAEFLALATRQGEAVAKLSASCEGMTASA